MFFGHLKTALINKSRFDHVTTFVGTGRIICKHYDVWHVASNSDQIHYKK